MKYVSVKDLLKLINTKSCFTVKIGKYKGRGVL